MIILSVKILERPANWRLEFSSGEVHTCTNARAAYDTAATVARHMRETNAIDAFHVEWCPTSDVGRAAVRALERRRGT